MRVRLAGIRRVLKIFVNKKIVMGGAVVVVILGAFMIFGNKTHAPGGESEMPAPSAAPGEAVPEEESEEVVVMGEDDAAYRVDAAASVISWSAKRLASSPHIGTISIADGYIIKDGESFTRGEFMIDMHTITESKNNEKFLTHIRSDDFFGIEAYPTAKLAITELEKTSEQAYTVTADLTIRDRTHEISFPANVTETEGTLQTEAAFEIDRTRWGVVFDSSSFFQNLGDRAIEDEIKFTLALVFGME